MLRREQGAAPLALYAVSACLRDVASLPAIFAVLQPELALLLRAGALAAPMYIVEERTIGPSLGADNIQLGVKSVTVGMMLVMPTHARITRAIKTRTNTISI